MLRGRKTLSMTLSPEDIDWDFSNTESETTSTNSEGWSDDEDDPTWVHDDRNNFLATSSTSNTSTFRRHSKRRRSCNTNDIGGSKLVVGHVVVGEERLGKTCTRKSKEEVEGPEQKDKVGEEKGEEGADLAKSGPVPIGVHSLPSTEENNNDNNAPSGDSPPQRQRPRKPRPKGLIGVYIPTLRTENLPKTFSSTPLNSPTSPSSPFAAVHTPTPRPQRPPPPPPHQAVAAGVRPTAGISQSAPTTPTAMSSPSLSSSPSFLSSSSTVYMRGRSNTASPSYSSLRGISSSPASSPASTSLRKSASSSPSTSPTPSRWEGSVAASSPEVPVRKSRPSSTKYNEEHSERKKKSSSHKKSSKKSESKKTKKKGKEEPTALTALQQQQREERKKKMGEKKSSSDRSINMQQRRERMQLLKLKRMTMMTRTYSLKHLGQEQRESLAEKFVSGVLSQHQYNLQEEEEEEAERKEERRGERAEQIRNRPRSNTVDGGEIESQRRKEKETERSSNLSNSQKMPKTTKAGGKNGSKKKGSSSATSSPRSSGKAFNRFHSSFQDLKKHFHQKKETN